MGTLFFCSYQTEQMVYFTHITNHYEVKNEL